MFLAKSYGKLRDKADVGWNNWKGNEKLWDKVIERQWWKWGWKLLKLNESFFLSFFFSLNISHTIIWCMQTINNVANKINKITIHDTHDIQLRTSISHQIFIKTFKHYLPHFTDFSVFIKHMMVFMFLFLCIFMLLLLFFFKVIFLNSIWNDCFC